MKYLFITVLICSMTLQAARCGGCAERREQMLARRRTAAQVFPKQLEEVLAYDKTLEQYENGDFKAFTGRLHEQYLAAVKDPRYARLLSHRSNSTMRPSHYHFGAPALELFLGYPDELAQIREARDAKLLALAEKHPNHFLAPLLNFMGNFAFSDTQKSSLAKMHSINTGEDETPLAKRIVSINREFFISGIIFNNNAIRDADLDPPTNSQKIMILELEMLSRMQKACVESDELADCFTVIYSLIPDLTKYIRFEKILQTLAGRSFKLPGPVEQRASEIQKEYLKERLACIRANRELAPYR